MRPDRRAGPLLALALLLVACEQGTPSSTAEDRLARARELVQRDIVIDTHIDVPYRLAEKYEDVTQATEGGNFDYPRAKAGGLDVPFMSIYTPAEYEFEEPGKATRHAERMIDFVDDIIARAPQKFMRVTSPDEAEAAHAAGKIGLAMGMENGAPIAGDLKLLKHFYDRGIRYITLAHSKANHIADSSYDENRPNGGLSPFGEKVVQEMNALGIMVDVSHISDDAFWDVLRITTAPPIASHSSARHFTPGFERNMSDEMIRALADAGGVIMINFGSAFLTEEANRYNAEQDAAYKAMLAETGKEDTPEEREAFRESYRAAHPYPYATVADVLDHIDHVRLVAGIDHVGIGSDFDGVGDSLPVGLKDVSTYPNLVAGLLERGYSEEDIAKVLGGNLLRVWRAVEAVAAATVGETEAAATQGA
ncbi:MAG: dipeptidase [Rhodothalassiaceae bacterium]